MSRSERPLRHPAPGCGRDRAAPWRLVLGRSRPSSKAPPNGPEPLSVGHPYNWASANGSPDRSTQQPAVRPGTRRTQGGRSIAESARGSRSLGLRQTTETGFDPAPLTGLIEPKSPTRAAPPSGRACCGKSADRFILSSRIARPTGPTPQCLGLQATSRSLWQLGLRWISSRLLRKLSVVVEAHTRCYENVL